MKKKPLADRVVIKFLESEEVTKGGIVLPSTAKEKPRLRKLWPWDGGYVATGK